MLRAALAFFVLALLSYVFGAYGVAGMSMDIAKTLLIVFLVLAVLGVVGGLVTGHRGAKSLT